MPHDKTTELLAKTKASKKISSKDTAPVLGELVSVVNAALSEVSALRMHYAVAAAAEDDETTRDYLEQLDQKLGAMEREGRKLTDQGILVVRIFREFEQFEAHLRERFVAPGGGGP